MGRLKHSPALSAVCGLSTAAVVVLFAPWQDLGGATYSGFSGWGIAAFVLGAFVAVESGLQLAGVVKQIPVPPPLLILAPAALFVVATLVKFIADSDGRQSWAWVGLALAIATVAAAYINAHSLLRMLRQVRVAIAAAKAGPAAGARKATSPSGSEKPPEKRTTSPMAPCDGNWKISMDTPLGAQNVDLTLVSAGTALSGKADTSFGSQEFEGGTIDGDDLAWAVDVTSPMPMTLKFTATVSGDTINGTAIAGSFGAFEFAGTRA